MGGWMCEYGTRTWVLIEDGWRCRWYPGVFLNASSSSCIVCDSMAPHQRERLSMSWTFIDVLAPRSRSELWLALSLVHRSFIFAYWDMRDHSILLWDLWSLSILQTTSLPSQFAPHTKDASYYPALLSRRVPRASVTVVVVSRTLPIKIRISLQQAVIGDLRSGWSSNKSRRCLSSGTSSSWKRWSHSRGSSSGYPGTRQ
jgi:hypothetical protein